MATLVTAFNRLTESIDFGQRNAESESERTRWRGAQDKCDALADEIGVPCKKWTIRRSREGAVS